jgi:hypothetical protein
MFTRFAFAALAASALVAVHADPNPSEPGPGDVFNQGANCPIAWDADTSGAWKEMYIELMTGDNFNMVHLTSESLGCYTHSSCFSRTCRSGIDPRRSRQKAMAIDLN